ncbi:MAG TPA: 6-phosphogluconolactonase [Thermomicrobiales bacterium]|nr:6-phosphogluconolactonase [Thermomicrobiales bacterium]
MGQTIKDAGRRIDYGERGTVVVVANGDVLADVAAETLISTIAEAAGEERDAIVALSGGSTPKKMGSLLAAPSYAGRVHWDHVQFFWGDERWVPIADAESNAGEAFRGFLEKVPVPAENVHPFETDEGTDPEGVADRYERLIREITDTMNPEETPVFDLIFLGMGDDGHTLSLFPGTVAMHEQDQLVLAHYVPKLDTTRLTFSPRLANATKTAVFLVGSSGKADMLHTVLDGPIDIDTTPSQVIRPTDGQLIWLVDVAAAARLDRTPANG